MTKSRKRKTRRAAKVVEEPEVEEEIEVVEEVKEVVSKTPCSHGQTSFCRFCGRLD